MTRALLMLLGAAAYAGALPVNDEAPAPSVPADSGLPELPTSQVSGSPETEWPIPTEYTLPSDDDDAASRKEEVLMKQGGILYGPSLIGETSFFPSGALGESLSLRDQALWQRDAAQLVEGALEEAEAALEDIQSHGGLQQLEDYEILYDGHWSSSVPLGIARGQFSNFTSDLLFSMERLSTNPYILERLHPTQDELPFDVDPQVVEELTGSSLSSLHEAGRLFLADHSYQKEYVAQEGRYTAACQGLFYIDESSNQFLPLAIKTNVGSDLTYTPLDSENDWLLAKMMYNVNDLFHGQIYHLAGVHAVAEIVHLAALRTLSSRHPVLGLLERIMYQAYAIRPVGEQILFNEGGLFDQNFALDNRAVQTFAGDFYPTTIGAFRSNYFEANLRDRGLVNATYGPDLPHFPFYEDGAKIVAAIRAFVESFVGAVYTSDDTLSDDWELQAWVAEANGPAEVIDFPAGPLETRDQLVGILTHMAWLTGVSHHVLNQGEPVTTSGVLPLHPASLYAPVPAEKGVNGSLLAWLPDEEASVEQISLLARFNRPQVVEDKLTTRYMFDAENLLGGLGEAYAAANDRFMEDMGRISEEIDGRGFDGDGLSQGMPFIWTGMDPGVNPFFLSV